MTYGKRGASAKERICDALIKLVNDDQKPYDQLTIQDIVDAAGVCRNSFYRNFDSKDEVFLYKFQEVAIQSGKILEKLEGEKMTIIFISFFETARLNREFLLSFYKAVPNVYFDTFVTTILKSNGIDGSSVVSPQHYYKSSCKAWVTTGLLTEWMKRNCDTPIETMVDWFRTWCDGLI